MREKVEKVRRNKTQWSICPSVDRLVSPLAGRLVVSVGCLVKWRLVKNFRLQKVKSETSWHHQQDQVCRVTVKEGNFHNVRVTFIISNFPVSKKLYPGVLDFWKHFHFDRLNFAVFKSYTPVFQLFVQL